MLNLERCLSKSTMNKKKRSKRLCLVEVAVNLDERNGDVRNLDGRSDTRHVVLQNSSSHPNSTPLGQLNNHTTHSSNSQNSASHPNSTPLGLPNNHQGHSSNPSHPSSQEDQLSTRKKRGKTTTKSLFLTGNKKVKVEFNDLGQPIGLNSTFLSSYLGALAREMVPMNISTWRKVGKPMKDDLWTCIQARFNLEAMYKKLFTKVMGQRWKEAKSRLVSAVRDASNSRDAANRLATLKPDNIKSDLEWKDFIKEKLSEEFELKSKKFKSFRAKNNIPHTTSRKGYARLAEDMKIETGREVIDRDDLWSKGHTKKNGEQPNAYVADCIAKIEEHKRTQSSQEKVPLSEDGVAKTFGPEHNGRVRGLGFGVTPTQLGVRMSSAKKMCSLENEVTDLRTRLQELSNLIMANMGVRGNNVEYQLTPRANTSQSQHGSNNSGNMQTQDGPKKCKLLNWEKKIVAEGTLASTDPNALVHHVLLGSNVWKVWVDVALEPQAPLFRSNSEMFTIQQAVGTTVAWHKDFISID